VEKVTNDNSIPSETVPLKENSAAISSQSTNTGRFLQQPLKLLLLPYVGNRKEHNQ
jgi:hypothetical protein